MLQLEVLEMTDTKATIDGADNIHLTEQSWQLEFSIDSMQLQEI
jgi:hypothetical protein